MATILFELKDSNGQEIREGDSVRNEIGQTAEVKFGFYRHHIGSYSSSAFGVYFDGDVGFYLSNHLYKNKTVNVKIIKQNG